MCTRYVGPYEQLNIFIKTPFLLTVIVSENYEQPTPKRDSETLRTDSTNSNSTNGTCTKPSSRVDDTGVLLQSTSGFCAVTHPDNINSDAQNSESVLRHPPEINVASVLVQNTSGTQTDPNNYTNAECSSNPVSQTTLQASELCSSRQRESVPTTVNKANQFTLRPRPQSARISKAPRPYSARIGNAAQTRTATETSQPTGSANCGEVDAFN